MYRGNNFTGSWSSTGGIAFDTVNNTEAVYLQAPATGTWTIRVTDGHRHNRHPALRARCLGRAGSGPDMDPHLLRHSRHLRQRARRHLGSVGRRHTILPSSP